MKNIFFICMFGLLAFAGCSDNEEEILTGGNIDIDMLPPNQPNDVIDEKLFAVINLDYPGLEKAKEFYNSGKYYYAVNELLEYYRNRTSVINPNIQLMNTPITASELNIADQALENRFYVRGFAERVEDGKEIYYSFTKDNKIDCRSFPVKSLTKNLNIRFIAINGCFHKQKPIAQVVMKNMQNHGSMFTRIGLRLFLMKKEQHSPKKEEKRMMLIINGKVYR